MSLTLMQGDEQMDGEETQKIMEIKESQTLQL